LEPPRREVFQEAGEAEFGLADDQGVGVRLGVVGDERDVGAAEHDRGTEPAEPGGQFVGVGRARRDEGQPDQVEGLAPRDGFTELVDVTDLPLRREEGRQVRHGVGLEGEKTPAPRPFHGGSGHRDEQDPGTGNGSTHGDETRDSSYRSSIISYRLSVSS
jgi:hypothetical protein